MQQKFHGDFYQTDPNENNENKKLFHKNDLFEDIFDKHIFVSHDLKLILIFNPSKCNRTLVEHKHRTLIMYSRALFKR